jgi:hypothetical protein
METPMNSRLVAFLVLALTLAGSAARADIVNVRESKIRAAAGTVGRVIKSKLSLPMKMKALGILVRSLDPRQKLLPQSNREGKNAVYETQRGDTSRLKSVVVRNGGRELDLKELSSVESGGRGYALRAKTVGRGLDDVSTTVFGGK